MKVSLVNFSTKEYEQKRKQNSFSAKYFGKFDSIFSYTLDDIDKNFKETYHKILSQKKGAGLWLWKPYFFNKVLNENIEQGDYLFHCDAASFFISSVKPLIYQMENDKVDIMCFSLPLSEKEWTSPFVLKFFNASDAIANSNQILGSFFIVKKTDFSIKFIKEWLNHCCNYELISGNILCNTKFPAYFKQHRFDQSILSLLCKKYDIKPYRDPSQYGKFPEAYRLNGKFMTPKFKSSNYKTIIILIRKGSFSSVYSRFLGKSLYKFLFPNQYKKKISE